MGFKLALPRLTIKDAIAAFLVLVAFVFLLIDSNILARGAARWADGALDRFSYGLVAFLVPWVVAVCPFVTIVLWQMRHRIWAGIVCVMWAMFVSYNVLGAGGAIAMIRADVISIRKQEVTVHSGDVSRRANLQRQLDDIPKGTRQPGQVEASLVKEQASPWWQHSNQCRDASNPRERKFCGAYAALQGELAAARALVALTAQIDAIDAKMGAAGPVATVADPVATFVAGWTGTSEQQAQNMLPLATPVVLMFGSIFILAIVFQMYGMDHAVIAGKALGKGGAQAPQVLPAASASRGKPLQVVSSRVNDVPLTRQREFAVWFFSNCTVPMATGNMPETHWYQHYSECCVRQQDKPMAVEAFRELARQYIPNIREIDGRWFYFGAMPLVPTRVPAAS